MKYRKLNEIEILEIASKYGKYRAKDLALEYKCTIHQIYEIGRKFKKQQKQNKEVIIDKEMNQILLSGILGDGRFKKNGKHNVIYSECHSLGEAEYLEWKFNKLKELTENTVIYDKNTNNDSNDAKEFTTLTTPSLIPYLDLKNNKDFVIEQLDELGLLLHLLDDGWFSTYTCGKNGRFNICTYSMTSNQRNLLIKQWKEKCNIEFKEYGIKRVELGASSTENIKIFNLAMKYFNKDIDIIKKKFGIIMNECIVQSDL